MNELKMESKEFVRANDIANLLGVSDSMIWKLVKKGDLKSIKIGKKATVFRKIDVDEFINKKINESIKE